MSYLVRPPALASRLFYSALWRIPTDEKKIFLSFDDGPIPEVTPLVLEILRSYRAKASFFCIGENITRHPDIFRSVTKENHTVGNHTYNHLNGWKTRDRMYFENIEKCQELTASGWFRPPYGKIKQSQVKIIRERYKIVMWDVLSMDYSENITEEKCLKNILRFTRKGSIVVFHDSLKAERNMKYALPRMLEHFSEKGFVFEGLQNL